MFKLYSIHLHAEKSMTYYEDHQHLLIYDQLATVCTQTVPVPRLDKEGG